MKFKQILYNSNISLPHILGEQLEWALSVTNGMGNSNNLCKSSGMTNFPWNYKEVFDVCFIF